MDFERELKLECNSAGSSSVEKTNSKLNASLKAKLLQTCIDLHLSFAKA